jgi:hypothetical protein
MTRANSDSQTGGTSEVVLGGVALAVAVVALVVALTRDTGSNKSSAVTTTTLSAQQVCKAKVDSYNNQFGFLNKQRLQLKALEARLNAQLTSELSTHSPNAGATDASHQAVLREQSDVQQRILRLDEQRPQELARDCQTATP